MVFALFLVAAIEWYLGVGLAFGLWFAAKGAGRLDPIAEHGRVGFRLLVIPGAIALWPVLLLRIVRGGPAPPLERTAHRLARPGTP